ncbi:MAG: stage III sporulation protein AB [Clostridia bacterium]|nr:stage III sporulation protein AB [Clostridia bacterium]
MRLIGTIILISTGAIGGCWASMRLQKRAKTLEKIGEWIVFLQTEFSYRHTSLVDAIADSSALDSFQPLTFLRIEKADPRAPTEILIEALRKDAWALALDAEDVALIERMFEGLGKTSLDGQLDLLKQNAAYIASQYEQACTCYRQKGRVFRVMGVCVATAAALILC